jgi:hypothetical protein
MMGKSLNVCVKRCYHGLRMYQICKHINITLVSLGLEADFR